MFCVRLYYWVYCIRSLQGPVVRGRRHIHAVYPPPRRDCPGHMHVMGHGNRYGRECDDFGVGILHYDEAKILAASPRAEIEVGVGGGCVCFAAKRFGDPVQIKRRGERIYQEILKKEIFEAAAQP